MSDIWLSSDQHFVTLGRSTQSQRLCGTATFNDKVFGQLLAINGMSNGYPGEIFAWETTPLWRILYFSFEELRTLISIGLQTGQKSFMEQDTKCRGFLKKGRTLFRWKVLRFSQGIESMHFTCGELQALHQAYQHFLKEVYEHGREKYL